MHVLHVEGDAELQNSASAGEPVLAHSNRETVDCHKSSLEDCC